MYLALLFCSAQECEQRGLNLYKIQKKCILIHLISIKFLFSFFFFPEVLNVNAAATHLSILA